jgi:large subunit ribosomal protein L6
MSRLAKKLIPIPAKTEVATTDGQLSVKGPLGTLTRALPDILELTMAEGQAGIKAKRNGSLVGALTGTYVSHLENMIDGVNKGFGKKLIIEGVGYRAAVTGQKMTLALGFSHPVEVAIPEGLKVTVEKNLVTITGFDKELVGQFAANIRALKKPEPYKGKGIRYETEILRRKEGKKVVS